MRSIEHGNLLDAATAALMAENGTWLVPTLATYDALHRNATRLGWSDEMIRKLELVRSQGIEAIRIARDAGVRIGYGTDLLGEMHRHQSEEFVIRGRVLPAHEVIASTTHIAAKLLRQDGKLGVVAPGAHADLIVLDGDPLKDLSLLTAQGRHMPLIMKAGAFVKRSAIP